ncbi:MAG: hypothetical protein ACYSSO_02050 [Planctomycetota bacterium]|jgi:hypothetical protein
MLKEKDIKYFRTLQSKTTKLGLYVVLAGALLILICGIINLRLAYHTKTWHKLPFILPYNDEFSLSGKYLGAQLFAQERFFIGLTQALIGGVLLPIQLYVLWGLRTRGKRILNFIDEHTKQPQDSS